MTKVIMGIGVPGSGKTSVLKPLAEKYDYMYVCPDDIRKELTGDEADQSKNREVWEEAQKRTAEALREGKTVVFDATFTQKNQRRDFIQFVKDQGAEKVQGVYADVMLETARERNSLRERVVPDFAIDRMHESLERDLPIVEDGFDSVFDIDEFQELIRAEMQSERDIHTKEFEPKLK